jgi:hypothetical protein
MDRLNPTIAELSQAIEQEVEKSSEARRLMTHPGVGALTALAFVLIIGEAERFQCGKQVASFISDWCRWRTPAGIAADWDTLPSKAVPCCGALCESSAYACHRETTATAPVLDSTHCPSCDG